MTSPIAEQPQRRPRVRRGNKEDAERLRQDMIHAAAEIAREQGAAAVSIRAVAAKVGISPMSTYRYFSDKSELFAGIWNDIARELASALRQHMAVAQGAHALHRGYIEGFIDFWESRPDQFALFYGFTKTGSTNLDATPFTDTELYGELRDISEGTFKALATEGGFGLDHARLAADVRYMMVLGFLHSTMVRTYRAWSEPGALRRHYIELIADSVERCLRDGARLPA